MPMKFVKYGLSSIKNLKCLDKTVSYILLLIKKIDKDNEEE